MPWNPNLTNKQIELIRLHTVKLFKVFLSIFVQSLMVSSIAILH